MKNKFVIINALISVVILFSILFQSAHSYEHLIKQLSEKKCLHEHRYNFEVTHEHQDFDKCFVCEFVFSSNVLQNLNSFSFSNDAEIFKKESYFLTEFVPYFTGISYSLRGPPTI